MPAISELAAKLEQKAVAAMFLLGPYFKLLLSIFVNNKCFIETLPPDEVHLTHYQLVIYL